MNKPYFLVGLRASGKTSLGTRLARKLKRDFVDLDRLIQEETGCSIASLVAAEGWRGFREREEKALQRTACPDTIIATGGGVILLEKNRNFLKHCGGTVVYLQASPEVLCKRLQANPLQGQRPSLTGLPLYDEVLTLWKERDPLYREVASFIVDTARPQEEVLQQLQCWAESRG